MRIIITDNYFSFILRVINQDPIVLELEWAKPSEPAGQLTGYRVKYGIKNQTLKEEFIKDINQFTFKIKDVGELSTDWVVAIFKLVDGNDGIFNNVFKIFQNVEFITNSVLPVRIKTESAKKLYVTGRVPKVNRQARRRI